ncbi:Sec8 exocyst complex component-specific domain-containing protein [Zychaea mexicana]|uniref:Sec8 exocyst complex component-specific domain-containing protein n=1 Tax=Zychaea mexicana TaxID=64656 RepID=UPI0022FE7D2F|nr:Sec8 exocyst complex component-specific domain-containing protein [Zychaea mexicana]KAI9491703.1 Sec8 exocyst complex component-specific domain-containing protein [Zychaea mexicana]
MDPYSQYPPTRNHGYLNGNDLNDNFSEIEAVLQEIHNGWDFMLDDNFDPVTLALALMDDSSVGKEKDYKTFRRMLRNLDTALEAIVDDYYKGFNNSIGTFGGVLQHINDSQDRVAQMKNSLRKCKGELLEKRTDLLNMWHKSEQHKEMLNLLETIEEIRSTPEKVERMMNSKHVLGAADLLMRSTRTINSKEMKQIGALDDLRRTLNGQKNTLYDLLIEELHNHLYLKSSFCDNRWAAYVPEQQSLPKSDLKPRSFTSLSQQDADAANGKAEDMFAVDENAILVEDTEKNPETDSYYYMEIIMESLAILGDIPPAMETVKERLPLEIHRLVDKTINDVEERRTAANNKEKPDRKPGDASDIYCLDRANNEARNEILKDLLWTLYSKLEAVLRGFRFTETCARRIKKRLIAAREFDGTQDTFRIYHFHEIWRPVQAEIRTLLQDYLSIQDRTLQKKTIDINMFTFSRDKSQSLFSFTESPQDKELDQAYSKVQTNLYASLKKQVSGSNKGFAKQDSLLHSSIIDKYASDMAYRGHKLLIKPDAYNVSVLLQPTMAFLVRLREVFPSYDEKNAEGFGSFLDDFAINVFLPQIEEKVMQLISHATVGMDAFQDDRNYKNLSKYPIVKSAVALISLIQSLCRTMHSMPFHTEEYIRMVEVVLLKYYEKCYQRFYSTVARGGSSDNGEKKEDTPEMDISTSGDWAQDESLIALLAQNPYFNDDTRADFEFVKALNQAEITMEFKLKEERTFDTEELIFESKRLVALGRLYHSLKWFVREIWELRMPNQQLKLPSLPSGSFGKDNFENECGLTESASSRRWSLAGHNKGSMQDDYGPVLLPLKDEAARRFDTLLTTYQQLAETCLFTLRLENRCHVIYYLEMAMQEGNYYLEDETYEPDPYIITLNQDLVELDDCITASLPPKDELFAFDGLPALIVHILISEASHIKRMNVNGVQKMMRNVLALQQNLANFVPPSQNSVMERAREYYQLFNLSSEGLIRSISENGPKFTFDEYRIILGLIHDIKKGNEDDTESAEEEDASNDDYSAWLLKLDDVMAKYEI